MVGHSVNDFNSAVDRVRTGSTVQLFFGPVQTRHMLLLGGPNWDPCPRTRSSHQNCLHPSGPISNCAFWVLHFMITFRHPNVNCKILTAIHHCSLWMYRPPVYWKNTESLYRPHPGSGCQHSIKDIWSFILDILSGDWFQIVIYEVLVFLIDKIGIHMLPAWCWKCASPEHQHYQVSHLG